MGELRVAGGAGGVTARLEDVDRAAALLRSMAADVAAIGRAGLVLAVSPTLLVTAPASPSTWAVAEAHLLAATTGPAGLMVLAGRVEVLATAMSQAAALYRAWDAATVGALRVVGFAVGDVVGRVLAPAVLAGGVVAVVAVCIRGTAVSPSGPPFQGPDGRPDGSDGRARTAGDRPVAGPGEQPGDGFGRLLGDSGDGVLDLLGPVVLGLLSSHTRWVEPVVATTPGLLVGLTSGAPGMGVVWGAAAGRPWPPRDVASAAGLAADAAGLVADAAAVGGLLREPATVQVRSVGACAAVPPPRGTADVLAGVPTGSAGDATIRVTRVVGADGTRSWVVAVPGTREWGPRPESTGDPFDLTGDLRGVAQEETAAQRAVVLAMQSAGVPSGEPVMLAGHSQGGLVVASLAADESFRRRFAVTHVVTTGAPAGGFDIPDGVHVLSMEHDDDLVPRLDGEPNPGGPGWVTVSRAGGDPAVPMSAHDLDAYRRTAALLDASEDPSVVAWRAGGEVFFDRPGARAEVIDVTVVRAPS